MQEITYIDFRDGGGEGVQESPMPYSDMNQGAQGHKRSQKKPERSGEDVPVV
jgi:hypothetical protein